MITCEHCHQQHGEAHQYCPMTGRVLAPHRFFAPGTLLDGRYRIGPVLGSGGMGAVFVATHTMLNKKVALKVMLPELSRDRELAARMVREAQAASATGHRNVALVTDMGWAERGAMYVVMELLEGHTFTALVDKQGPLAIDRAARLSCQVLQGLDAVHRHGIIHRDLKPDNLMVVTDDDGRELVKILDFGVSKMVNEEARFRLTNTGMVLGTPFYMAPEQARGAEDLDKRADLYAASGVLYTLLTGQQPLSAASYHETIELILAGKIAPPSRVHAGIPPALDEVVMTGLARDRERRYPDAIAFCRALEPFCEPPRARELDRVDEHSLVTLGERDGAADGAAPAPGTAAVAPTAVAPAAPVAPATAAALTTTDPRFAPVAPVERPLELAFDVRKRRTTETASAEGGGQGAGGTMHEPRRAGLGSFPLGKVVVAVVVLVVAGALWTYRSALVGLVAGGDVGEETVLFLVETEPEQAEVLVDGVRQVSRSIQLPRSQRPFSVQVEAPGYLGQTLEVVPSESRVIRVKLRRLPRRRSN